MGKKLFDFVIGNPPYQETKEGTSDKPVYNDFMDAAYEAADKVELITPARFLFNAGKTQKNWNEKMLSDEHFKVLHYEQDSSKIFANTDIKGGVAITYRDCQKKYGSIDVFSPYKELRSISDKLRPFVDGANLSTEMYLQNRFDLNVLFNDYPEYKTYVDSKGNVKERTERRIVSSAFSTFSIFRDNQLDKNDICILGVVNGNKRIRKWVANKYVLDNGNLNKWKTVVSKTNGSGTLGEIFSTPEIIEPAVGYTQSFIGIGSFDSETEACNSLKYLKTKFLRTGLSILKITQDNPPEKWKYVPLQDFTASSDIDWSKSVHEIDIQLYKKYGLSDEEISFIETNVKEMA